MQVCKEAGGRVSRPQPLVRRLGLSVEAPSSADLRRLDFAVYGLPLFGGLPICVDATIVSPVSADGVPHSGCPGSATISRRGSGSSWTEFLCQTSSPGRQVWLSLETTDRKHSLDFVK